MRSDGIVILLTIRSLLNIRSTFSGKGTCICSTRRCIRRRRGVHRIHADIICGHADKATGITARFVSLNIISSCSFKGRLVCCIRRAVCAVLGMSTSIALHDRAIHRIAHTADESTSGVSTLDINGGS